MYERVKFGFIIEDYKAKCEGRVKKLKKLKFEKIIKPKTNTYIDLSLNV